MNLGMAIILTVIAIVLIGAASHYPKDYDPRWIQAAAAVGLLVISTYIMFFLYQIEQRLGILTRLLSGDDVNLRTGVDTVMEMLREIILATNETRKES